MRFRLRTLLIIVALGPPVVAGVWWTYAEPPSALADLRESVAFAIVALVGCIFGPVWLENLRSRIA